MDMGHTEVMDRNGEACVIFDAEDAGELTRNILIVRINKTLYLHHVEYDSLETYYAKD